MAAYRLDELGWLQFEELAAALLELEAGVDPADWQGSADWRREVHVEAGSPFGLPAPLMASVVWLRPTARPHALRVSSFLGSLDGVCEAAVERHPASILVMTNAEAELSDRTVEGMLLDSAADQVATLGPGAIAGTLDAHPELRRRCPATLGVTDLDRLIAGDVREASTLDFDAAARLARIFVATTPYRRALASLEQHGFVVLTGPPEVGKTAIAHIVALAQATDGWEAHDCLHPDEVLGGYRADRAQVFVADDAFGSTEYRPEAAERWARELDRMLARMDERHWLVWTSRPAPLAAGIQRVHRERGLERFPDPGAVQVDASRLDLKEKTLILFRHARAAGLRWEARNWVRAHGPEVVHHRYFTPERIRRFVMRIADDPNAFLGEVDRLVDEALETPTDAMATSLAALGDEHRDLLVALLDAPPTWVSERDLTHALRRHHPGGLGRPPHELIDRLADHFLRVSAGSVGWVHPSWRDLVIDDLAGDPERRRRFLRAAGVEGATLAISVGGGVRGERTLPLVRDDGDWDALGGRVAELAGGLGTEDLARLLHALAAAVEGAPDPWRRREARALADTALTRCVGRLRDAPAPLHLLEAWLTAAADGGPLVTRWELDGTWGELLPSGMIDLDDPDDVEHVEEWSALVDLLHRFATNQLRAFGYPDRYWHVVDAVEAAARSSDDPRLAAVLGRLEGGAPGYVPTAPTRGEDALEATDEPPGPETLTPHGFSVASVLRDLG